MTVVRLFTDTVSEIRSTENVIADTTTGRSDRTVVVGAHLDCVPEGSEYYVSQLSKHEIKDIAVNLSFDMVGSPNYVRFVFDGDGSDTPVVGRTGSGTVPPTSRTSTRRWTPSTASSATSTSRPSTRCPTRPRTPR